MVRRIVWGVLAAFAVMWIAACLSGTGSDHSGVDASLEDAGGDAGGGALFSVGGTVSGLAQGATVVLQDNGANNTTVTANGTFTVTGVPEGTAYAITVFTQPTTPAQVCTVGNGTGTVTADVTNIAVTCTTTTFPVGGTVTGLQGTGLVLEDNNGDPITVSADGTFVFDGAVPSGNNFAVTVETQPTNPSQFCQVVGGTGTISNGAITGVIVNCATDLFVVGGAVSGLGAGSVVLADNGGAPLTVNANGSFAFPAQVASGGDYAVTVVTQPTSPSQTCAVTSGSGAVTTANVTDVRVTCTTNTYAIGGTVKGLTGTGLVLQDDGGDNLAVAANGTFTFKTPVASGAAYAVTALSLPANPSEHCSVVNGTGTVAGAAITDVEVTCAANAYAVGGTVNGLAGTGLVLQDNGGDNLAISADGKFTFKTSIASGATYDVTVLTQPTGPSQDCTVSSATGPVGAGPITSVVVNCATDTFTVGGTISGLGGGAVTLEDNAGDNLTVSANGTFAFPTPVASGKTYAVTVLTEPTGPSQTCTVADGTGTVAGGNVTSVAVACTTNTYTVGGTVTGLAGTGLTLQDNGGSSLAVSANGTFTFATRVASGATFDVTVAAQPTDLSQTCTATSNTGTVGGANVTTVKVACVTNTYAVGGTVSGLGGAGLVLQDNGGDTLPVTMNGAFTFATPVVSGGAYSVKVSQNPSGPSQTCVVTSGAGTVTGAAITSVAVTCTTNTYTVGGTVTGLSGTGLSLQDNGGDTLAVAANGAFTFATPVASGAAYAVTIHAQPSDPTQSCSVSGGSGTVGAGNVTTITVNCATNTYTVGGTVSGLSGMGLVLQDNAGDNLTIAQNGSFSFSEAVTSGGKYAVTVLTNPTSPTEQCAVTNGTGTITNANVTNVSVVCTVSRFTISGTLSGLSANEGVVVQDNGADNLTVAANGAFTFATSIPSNGTYAVTVLTNPASPVAQSCTVSAGSGPVTNANVTSVVVTCATDTFTVGGTVTGLGTGDTVVLKNEGGAALNVTGNTFTFPAQASGTPYAVTVATSPTAPEAQSCSVTSGGTGTVAGANVTNVVVTCTTAAFTVGGTVTGLGAGDTVVLQNEAGTPLSVTGGTFTFPSQASGSAYAVTVLTSPAAPIAQSCAVTSGGTGLVADANVTSVVVTCTTSTFTVGGTINGLGAGDTVVLKNEGGASLNVTGNTFAFPAQNSGTPYAVTVATSPTSPIAQSCTVTSGGTGTVGSANVTNVVITCTTSQFTVGGTVTGLGAGDTVVLSNEGASLNVTGSTFAFAAQGSGTPYAVTVTTSPTSPIAQSCSVTSGGTGTVGSANVTNVVVTCSTSQFTVGGTVTGLGAGDTVVLTNEGGAPLSVTGTGFTFPAQGSGTPYAVVVTTSPTSPIAQSCSVTSGGTGTVGTANVTSVVVTCSTSQFTVGGTVTGLGAGDTVVLKNEEGAPLSVTGTGFTFPAQGSGTPYAVTVATSPTSPIAQTCTVTSGGSGTVGNANVTNVAVTCSTSTFTVSGTVNGLGAGDTVVLSNEGASLDITGTSFTFPAQKSGTPYAVTVATSPTSPIAQSCSVTSGGSGTVGTGNVTGVVVTCTTSQFTVGGTVSGLYPEDTLVLSNEGTSLNVTGSGFTFPAQNSGTPYAVTVTTSPTSPIAQSCVVTGGGSGTVGNANVTNVAITCTTSQFTVSGTINGLGNGDTLSLQNGGFATTSSGSFSFPAQSSGSAYSVTVTNPTSPVAQSCSVTNGSGAIGNANVTNVVVTCTTLDFTVSGTVVGLGAGDSFTAANEGTKITVNSGSFTFGAQASGTPYSITVPASPTAPIAQTCTVTSGGSGTVGDGNVTNVVITCATLYNFTVQIGGVGAGDTVSLENTDNGDILSMGKSGNYTFAQQVAAGSAYNLVITNPTSPISQTCSITGGSASGTVTGNTGISMVCTTNTFTIGGTLTWNPSAPVKVFLLDGNGDASLIISETAGGTGSASFTFPTAVASGTSATMRVSDDDDQSCTVGVAAWSVVNSNVTNLTVNCNLE